MHPVRIYLSTWDNLSRSDATSFLPGPDTVRAAIYTNNNPQSPAGIVKLACRAGRIHTFL